MNFIISGASRGLGAEFAKFASQFGGTVGIIASNQEKLKQNVEEELPSINALKLKVEFLEDRLKKAETLIDKLRNNGTHKGE